MDLITYSEGTYAKGEFASISFVQDVLNGWRPPLKLEVIEGGKK